VPELVVMLVPDAFTCAAVASNVYIESTPLYAAITPDAFSDALKDHV
jgi:hypothetical protein